MADINGITTRRAVLVADTVQAIVFDKNIQHLTLALMTSAAKVAYKVNDDIVTIDDTDSNYLDESIGMIKTNIDKSHKIIKLSLISNIDCAIQWEIRK